MSWYGLGNVNLPQATPGIGGLTFVDMLGKATWLGYVDEHVILSIFIYAYKSQVKVCSTA